jgi:hypothetical protein
VWLETYTQCNRNNRGDVDTIYSYSRDVTDQIEEEHQLKILFAKGKTHEETLEEIINSLQTYFHGNAYIHNEKFQNPENPLEPTHVALKNKTHSDISTIIAQNAGNLYNYIPGMETIQGLIIEPITNDNGIPIGKLTFLSELPLIHTPRTETILKLCCVTISQILAKPMTQKLAM